MMTIKYIFLFVLSATLLPAALAQDPDIEADERSALESVYRSSDEPGEIPTGAGERRRRSGNKRVSVPKDAIRIGCVCMDDSQSDAVSIGACSGHGGVRYWLYRTVEGDTTRVITGRHERHPQPLDSAERSEMVPRRPERPLHPPAATTYFHPGAAFTPAVIILQAPETPPMPIGWGEIALVSMAFGMFLLMLWLLQRWAGQNKPLVRYALRYLLRHRERSLARQNRKIARKTRL